MARPGMISASTTMSNCRFMGPPFRTIARFSESIPEEFAEGVFRAAKRQLAPRDLVDMEEPGLQALLIAGQRTTQDRGGVDDDDGRAARIGIDVDQLLELDVEAGFFSRLADGRHVDLLAAVDVSARK